MRVAGVAEDDSTADANSEIGCPLPPGFESCQCPCLFGNLIDCVFFLSLLQDTARSLSTGRPAMATRPRIMQPSSPTIPSNMRTP